MKNAQHVEMLIRGFQEIFITGILVHIRKMLFLYQLIDLGLH